MVRDITSTPPPAAEAVEGSFMVAEGVTPVTTDSRISDQAIEVKHFMTDTLNFLCIW